MLSLKDRSVFLSELRPPDGYVLDKALATTFTLDLLSLLMAPLSMVLFEAENPGEALRDPTAILEALRRVAGRMVVFCQQGRIAVPATSSLLFSYLEPSVIEVRPAQDTAVFHPKVWLLRFVAADGSVAYRFLCLSRNLTFDRSWDTVLCMEGPVLNRRNGISRNRPLADFVRSLPGLAVRDVSDATRGIVELVADEVSRVRFDTPPEFDEDYSFVPVGIPGYRRPPSLTEGRRFLVLSPFLSEDTLKALAARGERNVLISRAESLDGIPDDLLRDIASRTTVYAMDDRAQRPEETDSDREPDSMASPGNDLSGLHAKLYIAEDGWDARLLTGSANATRSAMGGGNVEFMAQLSGRRSAMGIDKFLGDKLDRNSFVNLLVPYSRKSDQTKDDAVRRALESVLDAGRRALATAALRLNVTAAGLDLFSMRMTASEPLDLRSSAIHGDCFPIAVGDGAAQSLSPLAEGKPIVFPNCSIASLTGFIAFRLKASIEGQTMETAFVLSLPVHGMPEGREQRILEAIVSDSGRFFRYLLFLMADGEEVQVYGQWLAGGGGSSIGSGQQSAPDTPLLEELVRTFSRHPERLERIAKLVDDLRKSEQGRSALPAGFESLWDAITAARVRGASK